MIDLATEVRRRLFTYFVKHNPDFLLVAILTNLSDKLSEQDLAHSINLVDEAAADNEKITLAQNIINDPLQHLGQKLDVRNTLIALSAHLSALQHFLSKQGELNSPAKANLFLAKTYPKLKPNALARRAAKFQALPPAQVDSDLERRFQALLQEYNSLKERHGHLAENDATAFDYLKADKTHLQEENQVLAEKLKNAEQKGDELKKLLQEQKKSIEILQTSNDSSMQKILERENYFSFHAKALETEFFNTTEELHRAIQKQFHAELGDVEKSSKAVLDGYESEAVKMRKWLKYVELLLQEYRTISEEIFNNNSTILSYLDSYWRSAPPPQGKNLKSYENYQNCKKSIANSCVKFNTLNKKYQDIQGSLNKLYSANSVSNASSKSQSSQRFESIEKSIHEAREHFETFTERWYNHFCKLINKIKSWVRGAAKSKDMSVPNLRSDTDKPQLKVTSGSVQISKCNRVIYPTVKLNGDVIWVEMFTDHPNPQALVLQKHGIFPGFVARGEDDKWKSHLQTSTSKSLDSTAAPSSRTLSA